LDLNIGARLGLPLVLVVKVDGLCLGLRLSIPAELRDTLLLQPGLESDVELPSPFLQLLSS
jgi:hypothetical protein